MKNLKIIQHWNRYLNKYVYWISFNKKSIEYGIITNVNIINNEVLSIDVLTSNNISITIYELEKLSISLKYIKTKFKQINNKIFN